jgi:hypothetical protein
MINMGMLWWAFGIQREPVGKEKRDDYRTICMTQENSKGKNKIKGHLSAPFAFPLPSRQGPTYPNTLSLVKFKNQIVISLSNFQFNGKN